MPPESGSLAGFRCARRTAPDCKEGSVLDDNRRGLAEADIGIGACEWKGTSTPSLCQGNDANWLKNAVSKTLNGIGHLRAGILVTRRRNEGVLDILTTLPWWASIVVAATVYIGLKWILPTLLGGNVLLQPLAGAMKSGAWIFALIFLIPAPFAALNTAKRRRLLDTQTGLKSVRAMGLREFEMLVGEAFRRQGYRVEERGGDGPDGGIDLVLYRQGRTTIVQCKRWRNAQVCVSLVRELFGVMNSEHADEAIFVSSGSYTPDALAFVNGKPIRLIDGESLLGMIAEVQVARRIDGTPTTGLSAAPPLKGTACPVCSSSMVKRMSKTGPRAGQAFWGCSKFPACRGTRPVA